MRKATSPDPKAAALTEERAWKEADPISFQWPHGNEAAGFSGFMKFRNVRIRAV